MLGFDEAAGGDEVFRELVLARIIEPTSKADSLRVIEETGIAPVSYPTLNRRLPVYAKPCFRQHFRLHAPPMPRLGPASLVLYDVTTLHFETDAGDGFREPGSPITPRFRLCRGRGGCGGVRAARRALRRWPARHNRGDGLGPHSLSRKLMSSSAGR